MPAPTPRRQKPAQPAISGARRMTGVVASFDPVHHEFQAQCRKFGTTVYVHNPLHDGPPVSEGDEVVFLDKRKGAGFTRHDVTLSPARMLGRIDRGRPPVVYVLVGVEPPERSRNSGPSYS